MSALEGAAQARLEADNLNGRALRASSGDLLICLGTTVVGFAALLLATLLRAPWAGLLALHAMTLLAPAAFCLIRSRAGGELTVPVLLLLATFAAGPIGALGCAFVATALLWRRPSPLRLRAWYDYIAGIVERARIVRIYEDLSAGRLPPDWAAQVPRFGPILRGVSTEDKQRVLGVLGRHYHPEFRTALREALRNKDGFIRAQAAAVASRLDSDEKARLWAADRCEPGLPPDSGS